MSSLFKSFFSKSPAAEPSAAEPGTEPGTEFSNDRGLLWQLLIGGLIFRGIIAYFLPAGFDEAYYFLYSQHLDWSYFDHPPAVAWTTGIGIWLTGTVTPFTMRLGALSLFTGCLGLLYATGRQLFGTRVGLLGCAIASLTPLFFLSFGILTAPDNALMFFWSLALYLCSREFFAPHEQSHDQLNDRQHYRPTAKLVWISLCVGLACLGKYHGFILGICLVGFCLTSRRCRQALFSKWLWIGVLVFAIALFPIFYWNAQHDWISFRFQLGDRFSEYDAEPSGFSFPALLGVIAGQIGYLFPSIALPIWWVSLKTLIQTIVRRSKQLKKGTGSLTQSEQLHREKINFILWSGLPVAIFFTIIGGFTHTFPAWPAPGLWSLTLLLAYAAAQWPRPQSTRWLSRTGWIVGSLLMFTLAHITLGTLQRPSDYAMFGGVVSAEADPSTALMDAVQLRRRLSASPEFRNAIATSSFVVTREYWLSGYCAMAMPKTSPSAEAGDATQLPVTSFTVDPRGHAFWFSPAAYVGKDALLMSITNVPQSQVLGEMDPYFESITPLTEISTLRGGEPTETFYLYQAKNLLRPYPYPY